MEEGEGDAAEPSAAIDAEEQKHEEHLGTLHDAREVLEPQGCIEVPPALLVQGGYLSVDVMQGFRMRFEEAARPSFQPRQMTYPANEPHDKSVLIAPVEEVEGNEAEDDDDAQDDADGGVEGKVACQRERQVEED